MSKHILTLIIPILILGFSNNLNAQYQSWDSDTLDTDKWRRVSIGVFGGVNLAYPSVGDVVKNMMTLAGNFDVKGGTGPSFGANISYAITQPFGVELSFYSGVFEKPDGPKRYKNTYYHLAGRGVANLNEVFKTRLIHDKVNPYVFLGFGRLFADITEREGPDMNYAVSTFHTGAGFLFYLTPALDLFINYEYHVANTDHLDAQPGRYNRDIFGATHIGVRLNLGRKGKGETRHLVWNYPDNNLDVYFAGYQQRIAELELKIHQLMAGGSEQETRLDKIEQRFDTLDRQLVKLTESTIDLKQFELKEKIEISFDADILFDFDSADLKDAGKLHLRELARVLDEHPEVNILIVGHTDSIGTALYNQELSERRAESVAYYLIELGIESERLKTEGRGANEPIISNETDEGRRMNRRVDIEIQSKTLSVNPSSF